MGTLAPVTVPLAQTPAGSVPPAESAATMAGSRSQAPVAPGNGDVATGDLSAGAIGDSRAFDLGGGQKLVMKYVPGGTFTMGSPEGEEGRSFYEDQVEVTLSRHFWLGETEVTQGQWEAVMGAGSNPSHFLGDENLPVEQVDWNDAQEYVKKLNEKGGLPEGWVWSLPTEAQWERACRAGTETVFSFGDSLDSSQANFNGTFPHGGALSGPNLEKTMTVKSYEPNAWGLYDLHGNVSEWCLDSWDEWTARPVRATDPVQRTYGSNSSRRAAYRGGSWSEPAESCRASRRHDDPLSLQNHSLGFRVALSASVREGGGVRALNDYFRPQRLDPESLGRILEEFKPGTITFGNSREKGGAIKSRPSEYSLVSLVTGQIGDLREFDLGNKKKLVMKYIPGGTFRMGSPEDEEDRSEGESQVEVTLSRHFWLGETEVTQGQWEAVMGAGSNPSKFTGNENLPVEMVSWEEAQAFIKKLNEKGGLPAGWVWSLPTEAQWERACRAGTETAFSFGDSLNSKQANFNGRNFPHGGATEGPYLEKTAPVKSYEANGWGLYEMHGNVWEMCLDCWDGGTKLPGGVDPLGRTGSFRVVRGGGWYALEGACRSAVRILAHARVPGYDLGFRVALSSLPDGGAAGGAKVATNPGAGGAGGDLRLGPVFLLDKDEDEFISRVEVPKTLWDHFLSKVDFDGDGKLTNEEANKLLFGELASSRESEESPAWWILFHLDDNLDGRLESPREVSSKTWEGIGKEIDQNGDGFLHREEIETALQKDYQNNQ